VFKQRASILFIYGLFCAAVNADIIDDEELIDPTQPLIATKVENSGLALPIIFRNIVPANYDLTFIRASNTNPIAVINNQRVTLGDVVGGAIVTKISRSSVTLSTEDNEQVIGLYNTSVKRAVLNP
jgi:hypothetical protein